MACGGSSGSTDNQPVTDTGESDTSSSDMGLSTDDGVDSSVVDSTIDTTIEDTGTDVGDTDVDSGVDTADTFVPDTAPEDTTPPDTTPVDTATCVIGSDCNDGNACTTGETYDSTCTCAGGTAVVCDDSNVCTADSCNPSSGCVYAPTGEGTSCGAGKKCMSGICSELCTPGNACSDSNACTTDDKFDDTCACVGTPLSCDDSNVCTTDSCNTSTGCVNAPVANGTACGTGMQCMSGSCVDPATVLPTVSFAAPANNTNKSFPDKGPTKDVCNPLTFTITANAPLKIKTLSVHLYAPTSSGSGMTGAYCGTPTGTPVAPWDGYGKPSSAFKFDETKYVGLTSGTFSEEIAVSGLYGGIAPWLFCSEPGTGGTSFITQLNGSPFPAASTSGGYQTLANDCYTTDATGTAASKQWTAVAWLKDEAGNEARAVLKFWVYKK